MRTSRCRGGNSGRSSPVAEGGAKIAANGDHSGLSFLDRLSGLSSCRIKALVWIVAVGCFATNLDGEFVFDDVETIVNNADVSGASNGWTDVFLHDFWGSPIRSNHSHKSYRPLTTLTFRLQYHLHGTRTFGYHLVNMLIHGTVSILIYSFMDRILKSAAVINVDRKKIVLLASILFATHPVHTECVANITGRAELLSAAAFIISFLYHDRWMESNTGTWPGVASIGTALIGVLCKEQAIMAMAFNVLYDCIMTIPNINWHKMLDRRKKFTTDVNNNKTPVDSSSDHDEHTLISLLHRVTLTVTSAMLMTLGRLWIIDFQPPQFTPADNPAAFMDSCLFRSINYVYLYCLNIWLLLNPSSLCFDYSMGCIPLIQSWNDSRIFIPIFTLLSVSYAAGTIARQTDVSTEEKRFLLLSTLLSVITFLPSSNLLIRVGFVLAERVLYLPSIGYCAVVAYIVTYLDRRFTYDGTNRQRLHVFIAVLMAAYMGKCLQRSTEWRTSYSLFVSGASVCPNNAKVHYNLAKVMSEEGADNDALAKYKLAIRLNPTYEQAMNNLANLLEKRGEFAEAERLLRRAIQIRPTFSAAWMNLGIVLAASNQTQQAETAYMAALRLRPRHADCWYNLGNLYLATHRYGMALSAWSNATSINPRHRKAWINQMVLHDDLGDCHSSVRLATEALAHVDAGAVESVPLHAGIGSCLAKLSKYAQAEPHLLAAIRIEPTASNHANIGVLYHRWTRYALAEHWYTRALTLDPNLQLVHTNLAMLRTVRK